jgi:hypothetical protein
MQFGLLEPRAKTGDWRKEIEDIAHVKEAVICVS